MDESLLEGFAFYGQLNEEEKAALQSSAREHVFPQGAEVYRGDCSGLMQVEKGRMRAYVLSDTGREITLYRLERGDVCLFSASCALRGIRFDVFVRAETDARAQRGYADPPRGKKGPRAHAGRARVFRKLR